MPGFSRADDDCVSGGADRINRIQPGCFGLTKVLPEKRHDGLLIRNGNPNKRPGQRDDHEEDREEDYECDGLLLH